MTTATTDAGTTTEYTLDTTTEYTLVGGCTSQAAGLAIVVTAKLQIGSYTDRTTTVYQDGKRVGFIQHGPMLWAQQVLDQPTDTTHPTTNYHWPLQPGYNCGQVPTALVAGVRHLVQQQAELCRAAQARKTRKTLEAAAAYPADMVPAGSCWDVRLHLRGHVVVVLAGLPFSWADKAQQLLGACSNGATQADELDRIKAAMVSA